MRKKYLWRIKGKVVTMRRRTWLLLVGLVFIFVTWWSVNPRFTSPAVGEDGTTLVEVIVRRGDTLWEIADQHGNPDQDLRRVVFEIQRINGLKTATIFPGQRLLVPR